MPEFPEWLVPIRQFGALLLWLIFPLQLWTIAWTYRIHRAWQDAETARQVRWQHDMDNASKLRDEAENLRAQAEISLALLRRHLPKDY